MDIKIADLNGLWEGDRYTISMVVLDKDIRRRRISLKSIISILYRIWNFDEKLS